MIIFDTREVATTRKEIAALRTLADDMESLKNPNKRAASINKGGGRPHGDNA